MTYNKKLLYTVAKMYYVEDLKQESIGRRLQVSRYTISRILKRARDKGLVQVHVINPDNSDKPESGSKDLSFNKKLDVTKK